MKSELRVVVRLTAGGVRWCREQKARVGGTWAADREHTGQGWEGAYRAVGVCPETQQGADHAWVDGPVEEMLQLA